MPSWALKPGLSGRFPRLRAPKKGIKVFFSPPQDILKHLRVDVVVLRPDFLDLWQLRRLLGIADAYPAHAVGLAPFLQSSIVKLSCPVERPLELFCLRAFRVQSVLIGFQTGHAFDSQYTL